MLVVRGGGRIVVMPVGRRLCEFRDVQLVGGTLGMVMMLQGQVHTQPEGPNVGRRPESQYEDRGRASRCRAHVPESVRSRIDESSTQQAAAAATRRRRSQGVSRGIGPFR